METCLSRNHVLLGDMLCFQLSGCDVINVDDRGCLDRGMPPRGVDQLQKENSNFLNFAKQLHSNGGCIMIII